MKRVFLALLVWTASTTAIATGQTIPPPLHLPIVQSGQTALATLGPPTPFPTNTPTATPTATYTPEGGGVTIRRTATYYNSVGGIQIVGEVVNESSSVVTVIVNAVLRNSTGEVIRSSQRNTLILYLLPGMASPFDIPMGSPQETWATYEITPTWYTGDSSPIVLGPLDVEAYLDADNIYHVHGRAENITTRTSPMIAVVTLYGHDGNVVGAGRDAVLRSQPGMLWPFDVVMSEWAGRPNPDAIANYALIVLVD